MLSGFVLTHAYQDRFENGWSLRSFTRTRLIRIYPIYLVSLILSLTFIIFQNYFGRVHSEPLTVATLFGFGLLLIPAALELYAGAPALFPFDVPAWSLFFELIVNFVHAGLIRRRVWTIMCGALVALGCLLEAAILRRGTLDIGAFRPDFLYGLVRIAFSYLAGILLLFVWKSWRIRVQAGPYLPTLIFLAVMFVPASAFIAVHFDLLIITVLLPTVIILSADAELPRSWASPARIIGTSSYSVYLLHGPIAAYFEQFWKRTTGQKIEMAAPWSGILCLLTIIGISIAVDRCIDLPVRAHLQNHFRMRDRRKLSELGTARALTKLLVAITCIFQPKKRARIMKGRAYLVSG
jgi:peptidoglycan/LPS O-acetylase OafA/YrhL